MAQYAVPESDDTIGTWTTESGGTTALFEAVNDVLAPNDTDYIQSVMAPVADTVRLKLSTVFRPGFGTGRLKIRAKWDTSPAVAFVWDAVPTATTYTLRVGTSPGGPYTDYVVGNALTESLPLAPGTYYWCTQAWNGGTLVSTTVEESVTVT